MRKKSVSTARWARGSRSAIVFLLFPAVAWLGGCGSTSEDTLQSGAGLLETRDSSSVMMVHSEGAAWEPGTEWLIAPEPSLVIGGDDGGVPAMFSVISDARRFPDGRIVVLERSTREIRVFDSAGTHLRTFGGQGEGPGRFRSLPIIEISGMDTILTWDPGSMRRSWFRADGSLIRDAGVSWDAAAAGFPLIRTRTHWSLAPDGTLLYEQRIRTELGEGETGPGTSAFVTTAAFHILPVALEKWVTLPDTLPHSRGVFFEPSASAIPLRGQGGVAATGFWDWRINRYTRDGRLEAVATAAVPRFAVSAERRASSSPAVEAIRAWLPDSLPAIFYDQGAMSSGLDGTATLHETEDGHLWVRRGHESFTLVHPETGMMARPRLDRGEQVYDVLSPDLQWLGSVTTPPGFGRVFVIGDTYVLTEWRDDLGVSFLRLHDLIRP